MSGAVSGRSARRAGLFGKRSAQRASASGGDRDCSGNRSEAEIAAESPAAGWVAQIHRMDTRTHIHHHHNHHHQRLCHGRQNPRHRRKEHMRHQHRHRRWRELHSVVELGATVNADAVDNDGGGVSPGVGTTLPAQKARVLPKVTRRVREVVRSEGGPSGGGGARVRPKKKGRAAEATRPVVAMRATRRRSAPGFRAGGLCRRGCR